MEKQFSLNPPVLVILKALTMISCFSLTMGQGVIGLNWGRQTTHRLIPSMVVDLLLQNGIRHLKLFSPSDNVLRAFSGGDIIITLTLPNEALQHMIFPGMPSYWLDTRIRYYQKHNINIRYLHVGSEPFTPNSNNKTYDVAVDALRFIDESIAANGFNVTATTPHFTDVLKGNISKPSEADFRPDLKEKMQEFVQILNNNNAPFVVNMFPIYFVAQNNWDMEFSFIDNKSNFTIEDNGLIYRNVFEFVYDSFLTAIAKAGGPDLKLIVGQIGWPTDGYPGANTSNAERFFKEFLPYIKSNKGTPLRPGISIDVFIHSLVDETYNQINLGAFQRHWGVYRSNGEPKYHIDFTGQGRDVYPTTAKGLIQMPRRWCVFNGDMGNLTKVKEGSDLACLKADCTSLAPGGSCSDLDYKKNVSYAFNQYFQANAQADDTGVTCDFGGLGMVVPDDPSVGTCVFPVEILGAEVADVGGLGKSESGERFHGFFGSAILLLLPLFLIFLLEWG